MFEIKDHDAGGRIGVLEINGKKIETPNIFTVINPNRNVIKPKELKNDFGLDLLITNSYIIWKNPKLRESALRKGLHKLLEFDGLVMTDSGAFQLYEYGGIDVSNEKIIKFQEDIGTDLGVILDVLSKGSHEKVEASITETLKRAEEWNRIKDPESKTAWAGPIQGAEFPDLVTISAKKMGKLPFEVYALGTCVPFLEKYQFAEIVNRTIITKKNLPLDKPLHAFGVGLPQFFAIAVAAGSDLFDSAAYAIFAADDRYMTVNGTKRLSGLEYLPCKCPVCSKTDAKELKGLPKVERVEKLARHNLWVTVEELNTVKQAIREGRLLELVEERARAHPKLLEAVIELYRHSDWLEKFDPITKRSAFFYTGSLSLQRPAVLRHQKRLMERFLPAGKTVELQETPLGLVPKELEETYPLGQCEWPAGTKFPWDKKKFLQKYRLKEGKIQIKKSDQIRARARYQFGEGGEKILDSAQLEISRATGRVRRIAKGGKILATVRSDDGWLVPTEEGAKILRRNIKGYWVKVKDAEDFVKEGKSVMAKFVEDADPDIRPNDEVLVIGRKGELIGAGQSLMNREEMLSFKRGMAVKIRTKFIQPM